MSTPSALPAGLFSGIKEAKVNVSSEYIRPGRYLMRIDATKYLQTRKSGDGVAAEMTVVHVFDNDTGRGHSAGAEVSQLFLKKSEYFFSDVKSFVGAVMEVDPAVIGTEEATQVFDGSNPLAGMVVEVSARQITTQKNSVFTKVSFIRHVPPAEVLTQIGEEACERFFPQGGIYKLIQTEQQLASAA